MNVLNVDGFQCLSVCETILWSGEPVLSYYIILWSFELATVQPMHYKPHLIWQGEKPLMS